MSSKGIAFVTGAARGIGRAVALRLAEDGFDVAVNDLEAKMKELESLVEEIRTKNSERETSIHVGDVSEDVQVREMVEAVVQKHGGLDVMVANAGVAGLSRTPISQVSVEEWERVMNINARSAFLCYKYAGLQMIKQGRGGRIIGASSIAGKRGITQWPYSASKFAVRGLTQSAALEFGEHGITVNAYAPGAIDTPMLDGASPAGAEQLRNFFKERSPLKTLGEATDVAGLVSFLASKESKFITGQSISINGGLFFD
ncbi:NAD-binding protein [Roridomyces roridus]|uniref:NAD-binding protein n=1 Tax=Roridomyces roridus TaxID=1738132 RepID=A0AAD7FFS5_9AGAR|nr:NAD-binding protein [Roridomyces roridus]